MGEEANYTGGIALIVEGATEKVFYSELIRLRALVHGATVERASDGDGTNFSVTRQDGSSELVKINNVGTVTQMTNSAEWFLRACVARHRSIPWHVFLGYDTDDYLARITKFHQGDWKRLRDDITPEAASVTDLAASADIEDIMLYDYDGVLAFLGLREDTQLPKGRKGKVRMKQLHRMVAISRGRKGEASGAGARHGKDCQECAHTARYARGHSLWLDAETSVKIEGSKVAFVYTHR